MNMICLVIGLHCLFQPFRSQELETNELLFFATLDVLTTHTIDRSESSIGIVVNLLQRTRKERSFA